MTLERTHEEQTITKLS